ncbi:hypothetical protein HRbin07_00169 [bacterium HR07]|nr:hypothetical protein HRbin07_00169 [bacterium HR07]
MGDVCYRLHSEIIRHTSCGEDDVLIGDKSPICSLDKPSLKIDLRDGGHLEVHVLGAPKDGPHRVGDIAGIEQRAGNLIEQRCEEMVIVFVHEQHVHRAMGYSTSAAQPAKARSDDNDPTTHIIAPSPRANASDPRAAAPTTSHRRCAYSPPRQRPRRGRRPRDGAPARSARDQQSF